MLSDDRLLLVICRYAVIIQKTCFCHSHFCQSYQSHSAADSLHLIYIRVLFFVKSLLSLSGLGFVTLCAFHCAMPRICAYLCVFCAFVLHTAYMLCYCQYSGVDLVGLKPSP